MQEAHWISVDDHMPPELIAVLVLIPAEDHEVAVAVYEAQEGFYLSYDGLQLQSVEYWCRIPQTLKINKNVKI